MSSLGTVDATLVFPAVGQAAIDYLSRAKGRMESVVCAASVASTDVDSHWGECHRLPSIYEDAFAEKFLTLVRERGVSRVFCPVASVHDFMRRFIATHKIALELIGDSPIQQQIERHRQLMARATNYLTTVEACAEGGEPLSLIEVAGILRQASLIYGESNDEKLAAMMGVFATAPAGDVIEIGSLMGRSAFVLMYLAWRYRVGSILTVDPWQSFAAIQHDSPVEFQALVDEWDFEVLSEGFAVNMVPLRSADHAHLRMQSEQGFAIYSSGAVIQSRLKHEVPFCGKVAVIHIDGNHDYASVKKDCELWLSRMLPGAWLILDDYLWAHGDGPYRAGNELLIEQSEHVEKAFACGKALFVKFRG